MIKLTNELEARLEILNDNLYLYRIKSNQLNQIIENELIYSFDTDFDYIRFIYNVLDFIYYDNYYESLDYDFKGISRLATNFAFEFIEPYYRTVELDLVINNLLNAQESLDSKLNKIARNRIECYFSDIEERTYVEDLIDMLRFALYALFEQMIKIIKLKHLQYEYEEQLISDDLNE